MQRWNAFQKTNLNLNTITSAPQAQRFFRNELKKHTSDEIDKDLWLNSVVAVSHRGEQLKLRDLYSLWTNCPDSDIGRDCLKYYTNRQIEMFGLENLCCYLPVDMEFETESFSKTRKEIESEPMYKRRLQRMDESTFVIGGFLSENHWISVVSLCFVFGDWPWFLIMNQFFLLECFFKHTFTTTLR